MKKKIVLVAVALVTFAQHRPGQAQEPQEGEIEQEQAQEEPAEGEPPEAEEPGGSTQLPLTDTEFALAVCGAVADECREPLEGLDWLCPEWGSDETEACRASLRIDGSPSDPLDDPELEQYCLSVGEAARQECDADLAAQLASCNDLWWACMWALDPSGGFGGGWGTA